MEFVPPITPLRRQPSRPRYAGPVLFLKSLPQNILVLFNRIRTIGVTPGMNNYDKSKLCIFNLLNFFQFITGIIVPLAGFFYFHKLPFGAGLMACLPAMVSLAVLLLNHRRNYERAVLAYFVFYPVCICLSYMNGISLGVELSFLLYGILSVFFISDIAVMTFSIGFSMVSYFVLSVLLKSYAYELENINYPAYLINEILAIIYIFLGLYLIKKENTDYNMALQKTNLEVQEQSHKLQVQAEELNQLNTLKDKLFSVISHDLKAPLYGLYNLFDTIEKQKLPATQIRKLIPDIKNDLHYAKGLMENLLQWAKSQMESNHIRLQDMNVRDSIEEVLHILHLQAKEKKIHIENKTCHLLQVTADRDMINLVLRNLVSNAIKFTHHGGQIIVGASEQAAMAEIYVKDSGGGMTPSEIEKIGREEFYTTHGTAQEQGTGLGLMLCKEFLAKNGSRLRIKSEPGTGSTFSFALPIC